MRYSAWLIALATLLAACQTDGQFTDVEMLDDTSGKSGNGNVAPASASLPLATEQRFTDIPLPANLREDLNRTYVYQAPDLEIGRMVYTSKEQVQDLAQFFIQEYPMADWTLKSSTQAENAVFLTFTKPGKRLDVTINSGGMTRSQELVLHLVPVPETETSDETP